MNGDQAMRAHASGLPCPTFENPAWVSPKPLRECRVAIVTSAALHAPDGDRFAQGDTSYRAIPSDRRDLVLGHWSPNFDHVGITMDLNVAYPADRVDELAQQGVIGSVAARHYSFAGNQPDDVGTVRLDSGPACASELKADGVDVVLLTPV